MARVPAASAREAPRAGDARRHDSAALPTREQAVADPPSAAPAGQDAGIGRRLGATLYEALLLAAVLIAAGFALLPFITPAARESAPAALYVISPEARVLSTIVSAGICTLYCVALWSGGRRTLAMKTWRLALIAPGGGRVSLARALVRFLACCIAPALAIAGFRLLQPLGYGRWAAALLALNYAWAMVDPDLKLLQDRIAGTRLVKRFAV